MEVANSLHVKGMFHDVQTIDDDLGPFVGVRDEQNLLIQTEIPVVITPLLPG